MRYSETSPTAHLSRLLDLIPTYDYESWILADFYELITALTAKCGDRFGSLFHGTFY